jgi:hypothetical protein
MSTETLVPTKKRRILPFPRAHRKNFAVAATQFVVMNSTLILWNQVFPNVEGWGIHDRQRVIAFLVGSPGDLINLFFAFIYNILGVPIAAGVLYPFFGILLSLIIAGAAMSLSSVSVIGNALRLRSIKL